MKSSAYSKLLSSITCLTVLSLSTSTFAQTSPKRWFEVEVILFSQLNDKNSIDEVFPEDTTLPKYRKIRYLLKDFLTPDIRLLKRQLPICETPNKTNIKATRNLSYSSYINNIESFLANQLASQSTNIYTIKELAELNSEVLIEFPELNSAYYDDATPASNTKQAKLAALTETADSLNEQFVSQLSAEKQNKLNQLLLEAEATFSEFSYQYQAHSFSKKLCRLSASRIAELTELDPTYNDNAFEVAQVNTVINGTERLFSDSPYLISAESLQLKNIYKSLSGSRDFKPMLHIGWRQSEPAINSSKSIPMHLFAGENLAAHYQQQLSQYQNEIAQAKANEAALVEIMNIAQDGNNSALNNDRISTVAEREIQRKLQLQSIIDKLPSAPTDKAQLITQVQQIKTTELVNNNVLKTPIAPPQDWSIEGLFNIHLNHYLYITADFNIADQTLAEQASRSLAKGETVPIKSIRFSQNRRVISGEIHYFDHPYMGMVVQIRRYEKPVPDAELADEQP